MVKDKVAKKRMLRKRVSRPIKFTIPGELNITYKDPQVLMKFLNDRGKMISRRVSGITAKQQRDLTTAIKRARFLGLLPVGSAKRK